MHSRRRSVIARDLLLLSLLVSAAIGMAAPARAGNLDVSWTAPTTNVDGSALTDLAGYRVYYGPTSAPCPGSPHVNVPSTTSRPGPNVTVRSSLSGLSAGTAYHVSVTAVDTAGNESACTTPSEAAVARGDVSILPAGTTNYGNVNVGSFVDRTFTVRNLQSTAMSGSAAASSEAFKIVAGSPFTLAAGASRTVTVRFSPTVAASVSAQVTFTATDGERVAKAVVGTGTGTGSPAPGTGSPAPGSPGPSGPIITVTKQTVTNRVLTLAGRASGTELTHIVWGRLGGKSGWATGTTSWTVPEIPLAIGKNVATATVWDAAGRDPTVTLNISVPGTGSPAPGSPGTAGPTITVTQRSVKGRVLTLAGRASGTALVCV